MDSASVLMKRARTAEDEDVPCEISNLEKTTECFEQRPTKSLKLDSSENTISGDYKSISSRGAHLKRCFSSENEVLPLDPAPNPFYNPKDMSEDFAFLSDPVIAAWLSDRNPTLPLMPADVLNACYSCEAFAESHESLNSGTKSAAMFNEYLLIPSFKRDGCMLCHSYGHAPPMSVQGLKQNAAPFCLRSVVRMDHPDKIMLVIANHYGKRSLLVLVTIRGHAVSQDVLMFSEGSESGIRSDRLYTSGVYETEMTASTTSTTVSSMGEDCVKTNAPRSRRLLARLREVAVSHCQFCVERGDECKCPLVMRERHFRGRLHSTNNADGSWNGFCARFVRGLDGTRTIQSTIMTSSGRTLGHIDYLVHGGEPNSALIPSSPGASEHRAYYTKCRFAYMLTIRAGPDSVLRFIRSEFDKKDVMEKYAEVRAQMSIKKVSELSPTLALIDVAKVMKSELDTRGSRSILFRGDAVLHDLLEEDLTATYQDSSGANHCSVRLDVGKTVCGGDVQEPVYRSGVTEPRKTHASMGYEGDASLMHSRRAAVLPPLSSVQERLVAAGNSEKTFSLDSLASPETTAAAASLCSNRDRFGLESAFRSSWSDRDAAGDFRLFGSASLGNGERRSVETPSSWEEYKKNLMRRMSSGNNVQLGSMTSSRDSFAPPHHTLPLFPASPSFANNYSFDQKHHNSKLDRAAFFRQVPPPPPAQLSRFQQISPILNQSVASSREGSNSVQNPMRSIPGVTPFLPPVKSDREDSGNSAYTPAGGQAPQQNRFSFKPDSVGHQHEHEHRHAAILTTVESSEAGSNARAGNNRSRKSGERESKEDGSHICDYCGVKSSRKSNLKRHIEMKHQGSRRFDCPHCASRFFLRQHLETHVRIVHDKERKYPCDRCGQLFSTPSNMRKHLRTLHNEDELTIDQQ